jgi:hypothetical protein
LITWMILQTAKYSKRTSRRFHCLASWQWNAGMILATLVEAAADAITQIKVLQIQSWCGSALVLLSSEKHAKFVHDGRQTYHNQIRPWSGGTSIWSWLVTSIEPQILILFDATTPQSQLFQRTKIKLSI